MEQKNGCNSAGRGSGAIITTAMLLLYSITFTVPAAAKYFSLERKVNE